MAPPFEIGERVLPADLFGWVYTGLSGKPGEPRRYVKGVWVLELIAQVARKRTTRVVTIRTQSEDEHRWTEKVSL